MKDAEKVLEEMSDDMEAMVEEDAAMRQRADRLYAMADAQKDAERYEQRLRADPLYNAGRAAGVKAWMSDKLTADIGGKPPRWTVVVAKNIYLSGPMRGYPESNYPLFHRVTAELRHLGHTVYNPAEFPHDGPAETFPLRRAFADYSAFICNVADTLVLLPGWGKSLGVSAELALARNCKLDIFEYKDGLLWPFSA